MMNDSSAIRCFIAVLMPLLGAIGCSSESQSPSEISVVVPDEFNKNGAVWQKQTTLQQSDIDCLSLFFSRDQALVGSPEFEGYPVVFRSGKSDRRFYWLNPAVGGMRWRCVEFQKGKFSVDDGKEQPFE